jgi:putative hydrolase of the HAD superfamily
MIRILLFDLDETLYPREAGVMGQIRILILRFIRERLHLDEEEADRLRRQYLATYGTTLRGLQANDDIDPEDYLRFVHNIPLEHYIQPNHSLDAVLASLPQRKVVFTNASREHAERVLTLLGIRDRIDRIVDIRDMDYESKPEPAAYRRVCDLLDARPEECLLVEDNARNLRPARALGMTTVLVQDGSGPPDEGVDYVITRVEEIGKVVSGMIGD